VSNFGSKSISVLIGTCSCFLISLGAVSTVLLAGIGVSRDTRSQSWPSTYVASWALKRADPSLTACNDNTVETHYTTAWFQRSMFHRIDTDTAIPTAALHCYRDLLVAFTLEESKIVCHCQKITWFCAWCAWFSVRRNHLVFSKRLYAIVKFLW
jgi:hypothetical protein